MIGIGGARMVSHRSYDHPPPGYAVRKVTVDSSVAACRASRDRLAPGGTFQNCG